MSRFFRQAGDSDSDSDESEELMSSGDEAPQPKTTTGAKPAMSRFLRTAGGSDSDSSDSSTDSDDDSDSDNDAKPTTKRGLHLKSDSEDSDDDDEEDKQGVRIMSAQEKRLAEMESTGKAMENGLKINDWVAISNGKIRFINLVLQMLISPHRIRQTRANDTKTTQCLRAHSSILHQNSTQPRVFPDERYCQRERGKEENERDECKSFEFYEAKSSKGY